MKKHFLFILFTAFMVSLSAQKNEPLVVPDMPIDENTKLITFQERVDEKGTPQELYDRAMVWVKQYYKNTIRHNRAVEYYGQARARGCPCSRDEPCEELRHPGEHDRFWAGQCYRHDLRHDFADRFLGRQ